MKKRRAKPKEAAPLLEEVREAEPSPPVPEEAESTCRRFLHAETFLLFVYVILAILAGTANRVSFRV